MAKKPKAKNLTPEAAVHRFVQGVRAELHKGLDSLLDREMPNFLRLLEAGYVLVPLIRPMQEAEIQAATEAAHADPAVAGSITPSVLLGPNGEPLVKH